MTTFPIFCLCRAPASGVPKWPGVKGGRRAPIAQGLPALAVPSCTGKCMLFVFPPEGMIVGTCFISAMMAMAS